MGMTGGPAAPGVSFELYLKGPRPAGEHRQAAVRVQAEPEGTWERCSRHLAPAHNRGAVWYCRPPKGIFI